MTMNTTPARLEDRYCKLEKIGEGTYGVVYKAIDRSDPSCRKVAIKKLRLCNDDEGVPATFMREISVLKELNHPNIVKLQEIVNSTDDEKILLVFEYLDMDLKHYLDEACHPCLPLTATDGRHLKTPIPFNLSSLVVKHFTRQLCQGMLYCHSRRIIHRDLKPQNLLVDRHTLTLKIADFGLARTFSVPVAPYTHEVVTLWYRAPEILLGEQRYGTAVDMWSIGCILAEMAMRRPLFPGEAEIAQLFLIFRKLGTPDEEVWPGVTQYRDFKQGFPRWYRGLDDEIVSDDGARALGAAGVALVEELLAYDPGLRFSAKKACAHPFLISVVARLPEVQ